MVSRTPFRARDGVRVESILRDAKGKVEREFGPIGRLGLAIVTAATNSRDRTRDYITVSDDAKRLEREVYLFFEHLYFFTHLSKRSAFVGLSEAQMAKTQEYLSQLIPSTAVDSYFAHWPEDLKAQMIEDFIDNLNDSEVEYVDEVKNSSWPTLEGKLFGLFFFHASHVVQLCERESELDALSPSMVQIFVDEWTAAQFDNCVQQIKQAN